MIDHPAEIMEYDPAWPEMFGEAREAVTPHLSSWLAAPVEHVGATSVPGLRAKPVIDMLAPVRSLDDARAAVPLLAEAGWSLWDEDPFAASRLLFRWPDSMSPTHKLYVIAADHDKAQALVVFRDALRENRSLRIEYTALKEWLTARRQRAHHRRADANAKGAFVDQVLRQAGMSPVAQMRLPRQEQGRAVQGVSGKSFPDTR